jgi:PIN domain nuclease of toxin-antitoxin system
MILLDTCVLLWLSEDPPRLPKEVMEAIRRTPPGQRYLSAVTAYEIGVKYARGSLKLPIAPRRWLDQSCAQRGISVLPITKEIAQRAVELPWHHRDPADRIIISTGMEADLSVLTPDPAFKPYKGVRLLWKARAARKT